MHDDPALEQPKTAEVSQKNLVEIRRRFDVYGRGWDAFNQGKPNVCYLNGDDAFFWRNGYKDACVYEGFRQTAIEEIRGL